MQLAGASDHYNDKLMVDIRNNDKSVKGLRNVPPHIQHLFPIKTEIAPMDYVKHLAACYRGANSVFNGYAMNSISNTCSIPTGCDPELIKEALFYAYDNGIKALTFYPDGSRLSQPTEQIQAANKGSGDLLDLISPQATDRKIETEMTEGVTSKIRIGTEMGYGTMHVTLNSEMRNPGKLVEVYCRTGKAGDVQGSLFEAIGRLTSAFLQYAAGHGESERAKAEDIVVNQLIDMKAGGIAYNLFPGDQKPTIIHSACDGLAKAILRFRNGLPLLQPKVIEMEADLIGGELLQIDEKGSAKICPHCHEPKLERIDGCWSCVDGCGFSKC
jgi:hypothetical protein